MEAELCELHMLFASFCAEVNQGMASVIQTVNALADTRVSDAGNVSIGAPETDETGNGFAEH